MASHSELLSVYQDILRNLTVEWQRQFSPTFNFGCNVQDINTEHHVLNEVGSYGKQLNRILDVLMVLLPRVIDQSVRKSLTDEERRALDDFEGLARRADAAAAAYQGEPPRGITQADIDHVIAGMCCLRRNDSERYEDLRQQLHRALPAPDVASPADHGG
jgi:hypothetical protein